MRISEYERGYQDAAREAVAWLQARAHEMNDPHAKQVLNSASFGLGVEMCGKDAKDRAQRRSRGGNSKANERPLPKLDVSIGGGRADNGLKVNL